MKATICAKNLIVLLVIIAISVMAVPMSAFGKDKDNETGKVSESERYQEFLHFNVLPLVQFNDVLDIELNVGMEWDLAVRKMGYVEREGSDLWISLKITKMEFADTYGDVIQTIDFDRQNLRTLASAAESNDTNPQIFNQIKFFSGGHTDNFGKSTVRPDELTAAIHFPVYRELGHREGTVSIYGYLTVPEHYEPKEGKPGIYELVSSKTYDIGLIRIVTVDATGLVREPNYSERENDLSVAGSDADVIESVTVLVKALRLRTEPNLQSDTVFIMDKGTKLEVIDKSGSWYKVRTSDGQIGWARAYFDGDMYLN